MLQSLHIVNFAIIEDTIIELTDGATVFTGKTWSRLHRSSGHMRSYGVQATHVERQSSW